MTFFQAVAVAAIAFAATCRGYGQVVAHASLVDQPLAFSISDGPAEGIREIPPAAAEVVHAPLATEPRWRANFERWGDLNELSFSFRYRNQFTSFGVHYFDNGQQRSVIDGRFKFDPEGRYAVHAHVSSGRTFNWSYSDEINTDFVDRTLTVFNYLSPAQLASISAAVEADPGGYALAAAVPSRGWEMNFRQLYFSASPVKQLSFEYGSLGIEKGESTEATSYDDDGYLTGQRVRLLDPKHLFFDQLAVTYAYEGDLYKPSFFDRSGRLGQSNYHQFLASRQFGSRLAMSTDYTFDKGTHTLREAAAFKLPKVGALDSVRLELYQRVNDHVISGETYFAHQGMAVTGTKTFFKQCKLDGGFAHIDQDYGVLTGDRVLSTGGFSMNGDAFLTGTRAFTRASWMLHSGMTLFGYYTHEIADPPVGIIELDKQGFTGGMTLNFKTMLFPGKGAS